MLSEYLASEEVQKALEVLKNQFPLAIWETVYVTLLSTLFAIVIGLPLRRPVSPIVILAAKTLSDDHARSLRQAAQRADRQSLHGRGQRHGGALLRAHAAIDGRADVLAQTPARLTDEQRQQCGRQKAVAQRVPVNHVGNGRRAQAQLLRDITDAYTLLHRLCPRFCCYFIRPAQRSQRQHRQNHRISEKDTCVLRRFRI